MIGISFARWQSAHGRFFSRTRIYAHTLDRKRHWWTPFVTVEKRYPTWLGYWKPTPAPLG